MTNITIKQNSIIEDFQIIKTPVSIYAVNLFEPKSIYWIGTQDRLGNVVINYDSKKFSISQEINYIVFIKANKQLDINISIEDYYRNGIKIPWKDEYRELFS